jgi:thioredoxin-disulfide reductase
MFDVIIIGAGPAGMTAAIYASRRKLNALVIGKDLGGQMARTNEMENYPGFELISGIEMAVKLEAQAKKFGAEIRYEDVVEVGKTGDTFFVITTNNEYESKSLILAYGKTPRDLDVPGEEKFKGKGISFCATCDAPLFRNKTVAIVGGGNSALDAALLCSEFSKKVYIVHRRDEFRGEELLVEQLKKRKNVEFVLNSIPLEVKGATFVGGLVVQDVKTQAKRELKVEGIFVEIGFEVKTEMVSKLVQLDKLKQIIINDRCETSHPGIFAAGDITSVPYKQVVIAAGQGAIAALQAYAYIKGAPSGMDWGKH